MTKSNLWSKGLTFPNQSITEGKPRQELKQGRNWETGTDAETMEDAACFIALHGLHSPLSYNTEDYHLRDDTAYSELSPPTSIINQKKAPQLCLRPI